MDISWNPRSSRLKKSLASDKPSQYNEQSNIANRETALSPSSPRRHGFHSGILYCALSAGSVFLINLIFASAIVGKDGISGGLGTVHRGNCQTVKSLDTGLHLLINVLSTILLGARNYSMQFLSSPTRSDIDAAHRKSSWMHIGVPNISNLGRISWARKIIWVLIAVSSVPLHLMYNSAVFTTLSGQEVTLFAVTNDFVNGASYETPVGGCGSDESLGTDPSLAYLCPQDVSQKLPYLQHSISSLSRLENYDCMKTYGSPYGSGWGDLLLVSSSTNGNNSLLGGLSLSNLSSNGGSSLAFDNSWICCGPGGDDVPWGEERCNVGKRLPTAKDWTFGNLSISYCLGRPPLDNCELQFSMKIMSTVIGINLLKFACMVWIGWRMDLRPLVTVGDAIASFLDIPDQATIGYCLASSSYFKKAGKSNYRRQDCGKALPLQYQLRRRFWFSTASKDRWFITIALSLATISVAVFLLVFFGGLADPSPSSFGVPDPARVINFPGAANNGFEFGLLSSVVIANSPQLLLSIIYFSYNSLFTCMLLDQEWRSYADKRKPLRVTNPVGKQRSTYRLSLPYRYGIPLLVVSGLLHWLISQSIFLIRIKAYSMWSDDSFIEDPKNDITSCGYSPSGILGSIIVGSIVLLVGIGFGSRRLKSGMPLVGSCSAAISAACHPPLGDSSASLEAVKWGVCGNADGKWDKEMKIPEGELRSVLKVGHISFTSLERCGIPTKGKYYA